VEVEVADFFGHGVFHAVVQASTPALTSGKVAEFSKNRMNVTYSNFEYLVARPRDGGLEAALFLFEDHKDLNLAPAKLNVTWGPEVDGVRRIGIATDRFTRMVRLEGDLDGLVLDDNYFDLEPGRYRMITLRGDFGRPRGLTVKALNAPDVPDTGV